MRVLFASLVLSLLTACVTTDYSGFIPTEGGSLPLGGGAQNEENRDLVISSPEEKVIFVWNHGTSRPHQFENCGREYNNIPSLVKDTALKFNAEIYFLCSKAIDGGKKGSYTYKRATEIETLLDQFNIAGVKPSNIFLFGHSAGGWSSLIANRVVEQKFAGTIVFAPAFAGPRYETSKYPIWRKTLRPQQVAYLEDLPNIDALIFAYEDDDFNRSTELKFLTKFNNVELVALDQCDDGHETTFSACLKPLASQKIEMYIQEKLTN